MDLRDQIIEAMEQALREWDEGVTWVDTTRRVWPEDIYDFQIREVNVRYAPSEFAYKFGDRVAAIMQERYVNTPESDSFGE